MWVGRIRRCLRRSSTCEAGHRVCLAAWIDGVPLVCVVSSVLWVVAVMGVGLFWLVSGWLIHLCGGFALLSEDCWGCVYFRDKPARTHLVPLEC